MYNKKNISNLNAEQKWTVEQVADLYALPLHHVPQSEDVLESFAFAADADADEPMCATLCARGVAIGHCHLRTRMWLHYIRGLVWLAY